MPPLSNMWCLPPLNLREMKLAICTIQRDRAPWLKEWFAFHHLIGVSKFYFYAHKCTDNTNQVIGELQSHFDITAYVLGNDVHLPQLAAYQHTYEKFNHEFDWCAFIDGDEFLLPTEGTDARPVLEDCANRKMSALAVYWVCFGSSGHIREPEGLITENFSKRPPLSFADNQHVKSIVRGHQPEAFKVLGNSHLFGTLNGTFDEQLRPITSGLANYEPSHQRLRINHYCCQSLEFFRTFKQGSGAPDSNPHLIRPDSWWTKYDRNDEKDNSVELIAPRLRELLNSL